MKTPHVLAGIKDFDVALAIGYRFSWAKNRTQ